MVGEGGATGVATDEGEGSNDGSGDNRVESRRETLTESFLARDGVVDSIVLIMDSEIRFCRVAVGGV